MQIFSFLVFVQIFGVFVQILIGWVQNVGIVQKARVKVNKFSAINNGRVQPRNEAHFWGQYAYAWNQIN